MKKFSTLSETNKSVDTSTNKKDFIINLIDESLSISDGSIIGKDNLAKSINKIIEINDSKTIISVLESIKRRSFQTLNLEWINESVKLEKERMKNITTSEEIKVEPEKEVISLITESVGLITESSKKDDVDLGLELEYTLRTIDEEEDSDLDVNTWLEKFGIGEDEMSGFGWAAILKGRQKYEGMSDEEFFQIYADYADEPTSPSDESEELEELEELEGEDLVESLNESGDEEKYLTKKQRKLPEGLKKGIIKRMKKSGKTVGDVKEDKKDKKGKKDCGDKCEKDDDKKSAKDLSDEEKYLTKKQRNLPEGLKKGIIKRMKKLKKTVNESDEINIEIEVTVKKPTDKDNKIEDKEGNELIFDDFIDPIEVKEEEDMFIQESLNYMLDIYNLSKIMESIKNGINEEHHLEDKNDRINYILSRFTDKNVEKVVLESISKLPDYIKTSDIERTLFNLSDEETENLYLKIEEIK